MRLSYPSSILYIPTLLTKVKEANIQRENPRQVSTAQHTHLLERESYSSLVRNHCRECFGAWEVLKIFQKKPMRLGGRIRAYCRIWKASEDKTLRSPLVAKAWRLKYIMQTRLGGSFVIHVLQLIQQWIDFDLEGRVEIFH